MNALDSWDLDLEGGVETKSSFRRPTIKPWEVREQQAAPTPPTVEQRVEAVERLLLRCTDNARDAVEVWLKPLKGEALTRLVEWWDGPRLTGTSQVVLSGGAGCGKTSSAVVLAGDVLWRMTERFTSPAQLTTWAETAWPIDFISCPEECRRGLFGEDKERFQRASNVGLLILDDLGREPTTPIWLDNLTMLIIKRWQTRLSTIITTNLNGAGLEQRGYGEPIIDRLRTAYPVKLAGASLRKSYKTQAK